MHRKAAGPRMEAAGGDADECAFPTRCKRPKLLFVECAVRWYGYAVATAGRFAKVSPEKLPLLPSALS
jgi:hypothetical protein